MSIPKPIFDLARGKYKLSRLGRETPPRMRTPWVYHRQRADMPEATHLTLFDEYGHAHEVNVTGAVAGLFGASAAGDPRLIEAAAAFFMLATDPTWLEHVPTDGQSNVDLVAELRQSGWRALREAEPNLHIGDAPVELDELCQARDPRELSERITGGSTNRRLVRALVPFLTQGEQAGHRSLSTLQTATGLPPDTIAGILEEVDVRGLDQMEVINPRVASQVNSLFRELSRHRHRSILAELLQAPDGPDIMRALALTPSDRLNPDHIRSLEDLRRLVGRGSPVPLHLRANLTARYTTPSELTGVQLVALDGATTGIPGHTFRVVRPGDDETLRWLGRAMGNCLATYASTGPRALRPNHVILVVMDGRGRPRQAIEIRVGGTVCQWEGPRSRPPSRREREIIAHTMSRYGVMCPTDVQDLRPF